MTTNTVTYQTDGPVAVITLDDGRANALSPEVSASIDHYLDQVEGDDTIRALVITGREGRFSGGFDLSVIRSGDPAAIGAMVDAGGRLVRRLYGGPVPVVAACSGHAVAAGALLLLGCDVRIGPDAPVKIGLNEVAIGLTLPRWALTIAAERLSIRHRQRSVAVANLYDGKGAVDAGFLDEAVAPDQVLARATEVAAALAELDPAAYARTVAEFRGSTLTAMTQDLGD